MLRRAERKSDKLTIENCEALSHMQPLENVWKDHASIQFILQAQNKISVLFHCAYECVAIVWNYKCMELHKWVSECVYKRNHILHQNIPEASPLNKEWISSATVTCTFCNLMNSHAAVFVHVSLIGCDLYRLKIDWLW